MDVPSKIPYRVYHTVDDIYALPEGQRYELIDGNIYNMAAPSRIHQTIVSGLNAKIWDYIKSHNGDCSVYPAPFAVFINADKFSYVEPDISVICNPDKLDTKGCNGAPDWIIEVVSPSSRVMDYMIKLVKYMTAGVREYWVVDPDYSSTRVYNFEGDMSYHEYSFDEPVPSGIYPGFFLTISELM